MLAQQAAGYLTLAAFAKSRNASIPALGSLLAEMKGGYLQDNIFSLIRTNYNTCSPVQKKVADYVLKNPQKVIMFTLNDLAHACDVSETTIFRFLRKLNYTSYQTFRVRMAQELSIEKPDTEQDNSKADDSVFGLMQKVINSTIISIKDSGQVIKPEEADKLTQYILEASKVVIVGVGASSAIALDAYHKLLKLGINVMFCADPHIMNMICCQLTKEDLLLAISHSGESREILDAVDFAIESGCSISSITSYPHSTLTRKSDCFILSSSYETQFRSDAMTSRIIQFVIIDILYALLSKKKGDEATDSIQKSRLAVAKNKT